MSFVRSPTLPILLLFATIWSCGSTIALRGVTPSSAGRCPFRIFAVGWPVFRALPTDDGKLLFVQLSFAVCGQ